MKTLYIVILVVISLVALKTINKNKVLEITEKNVLKKSTDFIFSQINSDKKSKERHAL